MSKLRLILFLTTLLPVAASAAALHDPMRPGGAAPPSPSTERAPAPSYRLDSIILAPQRRSAIINGRLVNEGEMLGRAQITRIEASRVTLRIGNQHHVLTLLPVSIKTPSNEANP